MQKVIDDQTELRKRRVQELVGEQHQIEYTLNSISRVARQDRDQRQWAKKYGEEFRARYQEISKEISATEHGKIPAFTRLAYFFRLDFPGPQSDSDRQEQHRRWFVGRFEVGQYPFVGATVVSVIDAHSAVVRPRSLDNIGFVGRDLDQFYAWVQTIREVHERDPVIATNLPTTEGWKPGDVVPFGTHWLVRGLPLNADHSLPSPGATMEAISPDMLDPIDPPTTVTRRTMPTTKPNERNARPR